MHRTETGADTADFAGDRVLAALSAMLLLLSLVAAYFWVAGSFRRFLDETQRLLLVILRWSSLGLVLVTLVRGALGLCMLPILRVRPRALRILGWLFTTLFASVLFALSESLLILVGGL